MAQVVKELRVDVSQPNVFQAIVAKQHDSNSRFLKITLVDFGVKVEVPNTAKVTINANRPDGASESFKGEANNDGTITVPLAQWMLDIDGEVKCDVSVTNTEDNKRLTSTDFWLEVQKAANPNASIPLDPDGEILIIKPVTEINGNSKDTDYPSAKAVYDYGQDILNTPVTATATGSAITIESSQAPLQNLKLFGKTEQNGTPTPDAPVPLVSVGDSGSFEVGVYGGNILKFNATPTTETKNGITFTINDDNTVTANGTATANALITIFSGTTNALNIKKGVTYSISDETPSPSFNTYYTYMNLIPVNSAEKTVLSTHNPNSRSFTCEDDIKSLYMQIVIKSGVTVSNLVFKPMICVGETPLPYEPYKEKQSITFTDNLRGIGGIADEKDFARGITTQRFAEVDLSTLTWNYGAYWRSLNLREVIDIDVISPKFLATNYKVQSWYAERNGAVMCIDNYGGICVFNTDAETKPTGTLIYKLKTPIETAISETELNAYRQLYTNKGNTTILNSDGADMEISYYINKPNAQAIGNIHSQVNKDYLKLQQAIISTGGNV